MINSLPVESVIAIPNVDSARPITKNRRIYDRKPLKEIVMEDKFTKLS